MREHIDLIPECTSLLFYEASHPLDSVLGGEMPHGIPLGRRAFSLAECLPS